MNITVLSVGKVKEKFYRDAIAEYEKRLSKYCKLSIVEVSDEKTPDNASEVECLAIKKKEGNRLLKYIDERDYVIALAIEGMQLDSVEFSRYIDKLGLEGKSNVKFVIGGSLGLDAQILKRADYLLSFSKMTFPHQMMRFILLEQIYRGFRISKNEPYHK